MSIRLNCTSCRTAFLTADDNLGRIVPCPKCGAAQRVPATIAAATTRSTGPTQASPPGSSADPKRPQAPEPLDQPARAPRPTRPAKTTAAPGPLPVSAAPAEYVADSAQWVEAKTADEPPVRPSRRWGKPAALAALGAALVLGVAALVAWPWLRQLWRSMPTDPTEIAARKYLQALVENDTEALRLLGTIDEPPAIRTYTAPRRGREQVLRGSFAPLARFHADVEKRFTFDPELNRFTVRNALGPAAETLDALHDAKEKAAQTKLYEKMASGNPEDLFDAAESYGSMFANLAEGVLSPKKLVPTYGQLVEGAKPPLPPAARGLADAYAASPGTWSALLKRPFPSLKADGPFVLDRVTLVSQVRDRLASSGDPPSRLRLTLTRFRLEGIDTGWKVTAAERVEPASAAAPSENSASPTRPAESARPSPGEQPP